MQISVTFKQLNSDFNQEYANEYHFGKESDNNLKSNWACSFILEKNAIELTVKEKSTYNLHLKRDNTEFNYSIPDMQVLECLMESGERSVFAVSNKLIARTHKVQNKKYNKTRYYFYIKDKEDIVDLGGILIAQQDFPSELL